jgi:hypothetical protein
LYGETVRSGSPGAEKAVTNVSHTAVRGISGGPGRFLACPSAGDETTGASFLPLQANRREKREREKKKRGKYRVLILKMDYRFKRANSGLGYFQTKE